MTDSPQSDPRHAPAFVYSWLAFGCTALLLILDRFMTRGTSVIPHALGAIALLAAPVFFVPPFFHLKRFGLPPGAGPYYATTRVVDRGLYAIVRHPQYVGYALLVGGFALLSQRVVAIALGAGAVVSLYLQCRREENECARQFGDSYRSYAKRVPRFNVILGCWRHLKRQRRESTS